jgi:predicted MFS family arabinose efflux permease
LTAYILSAVFFSMSISSGQNLNLEQMPGYRGTMMSLTEALGSTGSAIGAALGGLVILNYGYEPLGLFLGIFGIAASIVFFTLTKEPINSVTE